MSRHRVGDDLAGQRLDVVVAALQGVSRSRAATLVDGGAVRVDGDVVARSARVRSGQILDITPPEPVRADGAGVPLPPVRYEDEHLLVVAKPAGLVVHPGTGNPAGTLVQVLVDAGIPLAPGGGPGRPGIVHRLDRDTSGLLVVAKTEAARTGLVGALKARDVDRRYVALADGVLPGPAGRVDAPIGRDPSDRKRFAVIEDGKPAVTHWRALADGRAGERPVTLLSCRLETGRTHQIRVHLAFAGAPVAGDRRYGASRATASALGLERPFLHAARLAFAHPVTREPIAVREPLPPDLAAACAVAGIPVAAADPDVL